LMSKLEVKGEVAYRGSGRGEMEGHREEGAEG
jgi:hypothetical protein